MMSASSRPGPDKAPHCSSMSFLPLTDWDDGVQGDLETQVLKMAEELLAWVLNGHMEQSCALNLKTHLDLLHAREIGCLLFKPRNALGLFVTKAWLPLTSTCPVTMGLGYHHPGSRLTREVCVLTEPTVRWGRRAHLHIPLL